MKKLLITSIPITIVAVLVVLFISLQGVDIGEYVPCSNYCPDWEGIACAKCYQAPNITWPDLIARFSLYSVVLYPVVVLALYYAKWRINNPVKTDKKIAQPHKKLNKSTKTKAK